MTLPPRTVFRFWPPRATEKTTLVVGSGVSVPVVTLDVADVWKFDVPPAVAVQTLLTPPDQTAVDRLPVTAETVTTSAVPVDLASERPRTVVPDRTSVAPGVSPATPRPAVAVMTV